MLGDEYDFKSIYIYANNETIKKRIIKRGDKKEEAERRVSFDMRDFKGIECEIDKIVYNNDGADIDNVVESIVFCLEKMRKSSR